MNPCIAAALAILVGYATAAGTAPGNEENRLLKGNQRNGNDKVYTNLFNKADAIAKKQRDRNEDVGGVSRLRGAFEVGGGGDIASKTGVVKSDGVDVDEDAILEEDAVSKKQLQINDVGKTNKLLDDELDAFVNEAEAVEDDEGVDHPDVGVSLSTGSTEVEEEEENNYAVDSGEKEDGVEEDDDTGKGVTTFKGANLALLSATCPAGEEKCGGFRACDYADKSKIGCDSCNGKEACNLSSATIREGSCNDGYGACYGASGTIGDGSCNGGSACDGMRGNVGHNACNGGDHACYEYPGYEGDIRDNCPSIAAKESGECPETIYGDFYGYGTKISYPFIFKSGCVSGNNLGPLLRDQTRESCATKCLEWNMGKDENECLGIEWWTETYSSYRRGDCFLASSTNTAGCPNLKYKIDFFVDGVTEKRLFELSN